ncbi:hypothetical protein DCAR_0207083 [Daucus carota subsp. sativus]|uniref:Uncharacterized protein n=3 Tax=Daucus carota subsp. sativus TaxID=79200 RepID=A0A175YD48_DAUCS|nr:hypothetical protein DCAR_0207083 [Daucus carota subsp. sativus]
MKKLAIILSPMTNDGSPDEEGNGAKGVGFSQYASPKKRSGVATDGGVQDCDDGFAKIVKKRKGVRSANIGKEDGFAPNSQVTKKPIENNTTIHTTQTHHRMRRMARTPVTKGYGLTKKANKHM